MTEKEVSELRRILRPEKNTITSIHGCYVNANREIISRFTQPVALMTPEENEKYLSIFRKTLSGTVGKNLLDISFSNNQITDGEEYLRLTRLKNSALSDEEALNALYQKIALSYASTENYVILLAQNAYDVPSYSRNHEENDDSREIFTFLICAVCEVKPTKANLLYDPDTKAFRHDSGASAICPPEVGFLFPAFDGRTTNLYNALLYSKATDQKHEDLTQAVFAQEIEMPAAEQNESFKTVLSESLEEACSLPVVRALHLQICQKIEEHKAAKEEEPLAISKNEFTQALEDCGIPDEKLENFAKLYTDTFGAGTDLPPKNIVNPKKFELKTPDVIIRIAPDRSDLVEAKVIDGVRYLMIRANEGVELNGLNLTFPEDET